MTSDPTLTDEGTPVGRSAARSTRLPVGRPGPRRAPAHLRVLARAEEFSAWLFPATARWPKHLRASLSTRVQQHALDLMEDLTIARYRRQSRSDRLDAANLRLERLRRLLRLAHDIQACPHPAFEHAMRKLDEIGRMVHGWRGKDSTPGSASIQN